MEIAPLVQSLRGKLVVSVQAYPGEPLRHPETMAQMAQACEEGGAAAIRCQGLSDIAAIKGRVEIPVIGLWKEGHEGIYITPTLRHAVACVNAGADIVAIDATDRPRPDGRSFAQTVVDLRAQCETLIMADCMTIEDIRNAVRSAATSCPPRSRTTSLPSRPPWTTAPTSTFSVRPPRSFPGCPSSARGTSTPRRMRRRPSTPVPGRSSWARASRIPRASPSGSGLRSRSRELVVGPGGWKWWQAGSGDGWKW